MGVSKRRNRSAVGLLALVVSAIFLLPASQAGAVTFNNACVNSLLTSQSSLIPVTMTATASPNPVAEGGSVTLSNIKQELAIPPDVFIAGYNAGVLKTGVNKIPITDIHTQIAATNTVESTQATNTLATEAETTITDPDGIKGTGDETATPGTLSVTYNNQTWTAKASGTIDFREQTVTESAAPNPPGFTNLGGGLNITAVVAGAIKVRFGCNPGTVVAQANPSTITLTDPGPSFASVQVKANKAPNTKLESAKIKQDKVTFKFGSNVGGSTFLCKLDKKAFAKCKSPKTYKNLKPGKHKFQVKARNKEGKLDPSPAIKKFNIKK